MHAIFFFLVKKEANLTLGRNLFNFLLIFEFNYLIKKVLPMYGCFITRKIILHVVALQIKFWALWEKAPSEKSSKLEM